MKTQRASYTKRGFTLMELMVAMAITTIIVTVLVSITSIAIDTWNRSRSQLRAARQAKSMVDTMARDFEALVTRRGGDTEWLSATYDTPGDSANASKLVFFTAATDRYDGAIGDATKDKGGDVSCVGYTLFYKDPIEGGTASNQTFVLNRYLVNPDKTFTDLLGKTSKTTTLATVFQPFETELEKEKYFVCENIFQFTVTMHVQVTDSSKTPAVTVDVPVTLGEDTKSFRITGSGILAPDYSGTYSTLISSGRATAVEISLSVISDSGIDLLRRPGNSSKASDAAWLAKNSYQYSKVIQLPGM